MSLDGGFGSAILELIAKEGLGTRTMKRIGIPDCFVEHGPQAVLREKYGLDAKGIAATAKELFGLPRSVAHLHSL